MEGVWRFDLEAFRAIHVGWHGPILDVFFLVCTYLGVGQVPAVLCIILWFRESTRRFAIQLLTASLVVGLGFVHLVKDLVPRDRPSNLPWAHPQEGHLVGSFPSGHTTVAFCVATTLWLLTRGTSHKWMGICSFIAAPLVGLSRVYRGVHWPTDALAGACLGIFGAVVIHLLFTRFASKAE